MMDEWAEIDDQVLGRKKDEKKDDPWAAIDSEVKAPQPPMSVNALPQMPSRDEMRSELVKRELYSLISPLRGVKDVIDTGAQWLSKLGGSKEAERIRAANEAGKAEFAKQTQGSAVAPVGRFFGQMAATGPLVKALGVGVGTVAPRVGQAIEAGGFARGVPLAVNMAGGSAAGMATAGLINPENAGTGGLIGGGLPLVGAVVKPAVDAGAKRLMQSALKPTIKDLRTGNADVAVNTLLRENISPNARGVEKLHGMVDDVNSQISGAIKGSTASFDKLSALGPLSETARRFGNQANPVDDLNAITRAGNEFLNHPRHPGITLPVQAAQDIKSGTYRVLRDKYGQLGTADTEAQKAIARGLKDRIAQAVPEISGLNARETELIKTLTVAERRALMELNKNPVGLSWLANNKAAALAFMADRSAGFKALVARALAGANRAGEVAAPAVGPNAVPAADAIGESTSNLLTRLLEQRQRDMANIE